jgi:hypothetical protein
VTPSYRFTIRHSLDDLKCLISQQVLIYFLLPVQWYGRSGVAGTWFGVGVKVDLNRWSCHGRQWAVRHVLNVDASKYCKRLRFRGGSIFVDFVVELTHEIKVPTKYKVRLPLS